MPNKFTKLDNLGHGEFIRLKFSHRQAVRHPLELFGFREETRRVVVCRLSWGFL